MIVLALYCLFEKVYKTSNNESVLFIYLMHWVALLTSVERGTPSIHILDNMNCNSYHLESTRFMSETIELSDLQREQCELQLILNLQS